MKRALRKTKSIRIYIYALILALMLVFSMIIIFNNISSTRLLKDRIYHNTRDSVSRYANLLDNELSRLDSWMFSVSFNDSDLTVLRTADFDTTRWHTAVYRLQQSFTTALATNSVSALFCYIPNEDYYLISTSGISNTTAKSLLMENLSSGAAYDAWTTADYAGSHYILHAVKIQGISIGAIVRLSDFLNVGGSTRLMLLRDDGLLIGQGTDPEQLKPVENDQEPGYKIEDVSSEKSFIVYVPLQHSNQSLAQIIPYNEISTESRSFSSIIIIIAVALLLTVVLLFLFLEASVIRPLSEMTRGINDLRSGNLDAYVQSRNFPAEFTEVSQAFNDTVSEIRDLKIDIYERRLQTQNLELQFVKQQITPHFMINCLNTAYQLTDSGHADLAREMLSDLSSHLRYTLSSGQTVRLSDEIDFVRNYLKISDIRYPGALSAKISCPAAIQDATVVPLMLLNFVENTIKHEVRMGHLLKIFIDIREENDRLLVSIRDTGSGFTEEALNYLRGLDPETWSDSTHIGISNVVIRLKHIFPDAAFRFYNYDEDGGAVIEINMPYERIAS